MGTWGHGGFENDGALQWFDELDALGVTAIGSALRGSLSDVDAAQAAIAAAECIAAARGHGVKQLPAPVVAWLALAPKISPRDHRRAIEAVAEVRDRSELTELWNGAKGWTRALASLSKRLEAKPVRLKRVPRLKRMTRVPRLTRLTRVTRVPHANRAKAPPPQIHHHSAQSPDGELVATATSVGDEAACTVSIEGEGGGGSVFVADCRYDAIALSWRGNAVLEIGHPKSIVIERQDDEWQLYRRVVRVSTRPRATRPKRSAGRRSPGRARS